MQWGEMGRLRFQSRSLSFRLMLGFSYSIGHIIGYFIAIGYFYLYIYMINLARLVPVVTSHADHCI